MDPGHQKKIHNGADDNASGTSLVLELAKRFQFKKPKKTIVFNFFNAEELGLLGSAHFISSWKRYAEKYGNLYGMLNFDMVGRFQKSLSIMGLNSGFEWDKILAELNPHSKLATDLIQKALGSSDHASFIQYGVPSLFFTTGAHQDYHRSTDTVEKIDFVSLQKIATIAENLLDKITENTLLSFNPEASDGDTGDNRGYGAHLGCVPNFAQPDEIVGVLCTRAVPDSPAARAGVTSNDVIVQIGDIEIKSLYDLAFALKYYRAGDKVLLSWVRQDQVFNTFIRLAKRNARNKILHACHMKTY